MSIGVAVPYARGVSSDRRRIVIADDDALLREGIASLLGSRGYDVVGQASDGVELLRLVDELEPDVVVTDIRMPPTHTTEGLDAATTLRVTHPQIGILVLSAYVDVVNALTLIGAGTRVGYLLKSRVTAISELVDAVDRIADGGTVIDPVVVEELIGHVKHDDPLHVLSGRELDILGLMAQGLSNVGIAHTLGVTKSAVEKRVRAILEKLDLPATENDHRRVLAVMAYLRSR